MPSPRGPCNLQSQLSMARDCPSPSPCVQLPTTSTFPMLAWCYPATPSHSKKRGDAAPSLRSAMPADVSIIDLRETPALLGVC